MERGSMKNNVLNKTAVKNIFAMHDRQLGKGAMEMLEEHISRELNTMAKRMVEGNTKRLVPDLFWVALGKWNK